MAELREGMVNAPEAIVPIQSGTDASVRETHPAHIDVDLSTLTIEGLIQACPHYAGLAAVNPDLARTKASEDLEHAREEARRQEGMGKEEKADNFWSSMSDLVGEQTEMKKRVAPEIPTRRHREDPVRIPDAAEQYAEQSILRSRPDEDSRLLSQGFAVETAPAATRKEAEELLMTQPQATAISTWAEIGGVGLATYMERLLPYEVSEQTLQQPVVVAEPVLPEVKRVVAPDSGMSSSAIPLELPAQDALDIDEDTWPLESLPWAGLSVHERDVVSDGEEAMGADALEKEPLATYAEFTEALQALITALEAKVDNDAEEFAPLDRIEPTDEQQAMSEGRSEPEVLPVIVLTVAEHLAEITPDEKERVTTTLEEIIAVAHVIETLEEETPELEHLETATAQLKEQVLILFEQLGVGYEAEDIERFATLLLQPDFRSSLSETVEDIAPGLEHDGTREAKKSLTQAMSDGVVKLEDKVGRLLGKLVLLYSTGQRQPATS